MTDTTSMKATLEAERAQLLTDLRTIAVHDPATGDWEAIPDTSEMGEVDENTEADVIEAWNERRATVAALEITLRDIELALEKLTVGTYGTCEICGRSIESDRLEVLPSARTCETHMGDELELAL
jgi:RNA polymerase-binding transcription factor DksA